MMEVDEECGVTGVSGGESDPKPLPEVETEIGVAVSVPVEEAEAGVSHISPVSSSPPSYNNPQDEEFVWEDYLDETQTEAVTPTAFAHVEKSLESGVLPDQMVEVLHFGKEQQPTGYWLAKVVTTCGPLLRLRYVTGNHLINVECWREVVRGGLRAVGWSRTHNIPLSVPPDLNEELSEGNNKEVAEKAVMEAHKEGVAVAEEALEVDGYTAVDRIKQGMKLEVLFSGEGLCGWVATVMENVGGRLLLRYDTPNCSGDTFWLFYQHPRLRPPDWIHQNSRTWKYQPPSSCSGYEEAEWGALLEMSRADAQHSPMPSSLLCQPSTVRHNLHAGVRIEVVHPSKPNVVCVGIVAQVLDEYYFKVQLDVKGEETISWITSISDPWVLPCGFCKENDLTLLPPSSWDSEESFEWSLCPGIECATKSIFPVLARAECVGFFPGMRLEAVNPQCPSQICVATVKQTCKHLLVIQLDSEPDAKPVIHSVNSQDLFPTGWAQGNNYPIQIPAQYCPRPRRQEEPMEEEGNEKIDGGSSGDTLSGKQQSMWCPQLFINHWCYTGPYLSKTKVAKQSQSVGPGPVELVLIKVMTATISAAYIPTRCLREIQRNAPDPSTIPSTWRQIPFKAKFKRYTFTTNIAIATIASDVNEFLYNICGILQCCPNLWSTVPSGENCPLLCTAHMALPGNPTFGVKGKGRVVLSKGVRGMGGAVRMLSRRKRGGRKRLFVPIKTSRIFQPKTLSASADDVIEDLEEEEDGELGLEEVEEDDVVSGSDEGDTSSRSSRPTSPCMDRRRKSFSRFDIQGRGMKLSDEGSQIKMKQKKRFDIQEGGPSGILFQEEPFARREQLKRNRKNYAADTNCGLEPATVTSDPLDWTVNDVEQYVAGQPSISHHALKLREEEIDGRAFLLLNLPTLVQHLGLPHSSAVALAQHICRVKLAHFMFYPTKTEA